MTRRDDNEAEHEDTSEYEYEHEDTAEHEYEHEDDVRVCTLNLYSLTSNL